MNKAQNTSLIQELRAQLERVVRDPRLKIEDGLGDRCRAALWGEGTWSAGLAFIYDEDPTQAWRIAILTAAIRAVVVTREPDAE